MSVYPVTRYTSQPQAISLSIFQHLQNRCQGFFRTSAGKSYSHIAAEDLNIIRNAFRAQRNNSAFCEQAFPHPSQTVVVCLFFYSVKFTPSWYRHARWLTFCYLLCPVLQRHLILYRLYFCTNLSHPFSFSDSFQASPIYSSDLLRPDETILYRFGLLGWSRGYLGVTNKTAPEEYRSFDREISSGVNSICRDEGLFWGYYICTAKIF